MKNKQTIQKSYRLKQQHFWVRDAMQKLNPYRPNSRSVFIGMYKNDALKPYKTTYKKVIA